MFYFATFRKEMYDTDAALCGRLALFSSRFVLLLYALFQLGTLATQCALSKCSLLVIVRLLDTALKSN